MIRNNFVFLVFWAAIITVQFVFGVYMLKMGFGLEVLSWWPIVVNFIAQISLIAMSQRIQVIFKP